MNMLSFPRTVKNCFNWEWIFFSYVNQAPGSPAVDCFELGLCSSCPTTPFFFLQLIVYDLTCIKYCFFFLEKNSTINKIRVEKITRVTTLEVTRIKSIEIRT